MSGDDDDRGTDPAFAGPPDPKERYRRAIAFLQRARDLPDLSPGQIDRIERRLQEHPARPARRLWLSPALAVLIVLLLAGGALAMAGSDLTWLSGIGHWLGARPEQPSATAPQPGIRTPRAEAPGDSPAAPPTATPESPPPTAVIASSARIETARERAHERGRSKDLATRKAYPLANPPQRQTAGEGTGSLASHPIASAGEASADLARGEVTPPPHVEPPPAPGPSPLSPAARAAEMPAARPPAPIPTPVLAPNPIVAESRSFASALERWHRDHDAGAALAALDVHERRFPSGQLGLEARLLRVEILLASGRESDALALLDHMGIAGVPRARELRTVRGELRIKLGRCADGKADLKAVLAGGTADPLAERARQAIAACP